MKKIFLLLLIALINAGMVFATDDDLGFSSLSSQATFGLFGNALDDAANVGSGFTELENNYLFGGIVANVEELADGDTSSSFVTGYYQASEHPWSVFAYVNFANADKGTESAPVDTTEETVVYNAAGETTTTTYEVPTYGTIETQLQFLKSLEFRFGAFETGAKMSFSTTDGKSAADNFTEDSQVTGDIYKNTYTQKFTDPNGSLFSGSGLDGDETPSNFNFTLNVPFFMEKDGLDHKAAIYYANNTDDYSWSVDESNTTTSTTYSETMNWTQGSNTFGAWYELTMPMGSGDLSPFVILAMETGFAEADYSDDDGTTKTSTTYKYDYAPGMTFGLGAAYSLSFQPAGDWLQFKLKPGAYYNRVSSTYATGATITASTTGSPSVTSTTKDGKDEEVTNTIAATLTSAIEMKPENWFIGFQMGSQIVLGYENQTTESKTADSYDSTGTLVGTENTTTKTVNYNDWASTVSMQYGFFVPLPEDYRLDFKLTTSNNSALNVLDFDDVTLQLIVPLK